MSEQRIVPIDGIETLYAIDQAASDERSPHFVRVPGEVDAVRRRFDGRS
jgi:hypothetical protein